MSEPMSREALILMLRMKHDTVLRRGKPKLGQVYPDGQIDLTFELTPVPSKNWWDSLAVATESTVMEGRVTGTGTVMKVESTEDELENDVRRADEVIQSANHIYEEKFKEAQKQLDHYNQPDHSDEDLEAKKRRLEERLKKLG